MFPAIISSKESLPSANDIESIANYWKNHYNTELGKGTAEEFIFNYNRYVSVASWNG